MGPQNMIPGDTFGIDLPEVKIDDTQMSELKNTARFSKTKEFKELEAYINRRIEFYQQYLPDGRNPAGVDFNTDLYWRLANLVVAEFKTLISQYKGAEEMVKDELARRKGA